MRTEDWHLTDDLDTFLLHAGGFLRSRPALHTLALTVTEGLRRRGMRAYGQGAPFFGALERDGTVRAAYFCTPPHPLQVTPLTAEEAHSLAAHLAGHARAVTGVGGEQHSAATLAEAWRRHTGATAGLHERLRLYELGPLTAPRPAPGGRARLAEQRDRELLVRWFGAFSEEAGDGATTDAAPRVDARLAYGGITLWEAPDGTPVSMAGLTPPVAGQIRVAPVYTPAHLRGRGYAGAATVAVSRLARERGADEVLLFADLANPTSNALYQRIGYRPVADFAVWRFGG